MGVVLTIVVMIVIGAAIGGVTNSLAIKMLFRPYEAKFIGKTKIPFTPGLIPKRRDELANQMGKMVVEHLLTPESIQKKFNDPKFQQEMIGMAKVEVDKVLASKRTVHELTSEFLGENIEDKFNLWLDKKVDDGLSSLTNKKLTEIVPAETIASFDQKVPVVSSYIIQKGVQFFESEEGKARLGKMIDDFLASRGTLGNMVHMFLGQGSLTSKVQPEVIKFLKNKETTDLVASVIDTEWEKIKEWEFRKLDDLIGGNQLKTLIMTKLKDALPIKTWLNMSVADIVAPYKPIILEEWVPKIVDQAGTYVSNQIEDMMERVHIAEIVRNQVSTFSVGRLEEMVLSISKREFKMITYLGALLGGIIGFFQGLLVFLTK